MYKFCLSHTHFNHIDDIGYIPVGLGENKFPSNWLRDNTGQNISDKNKYYDMYSFHYWLWKNYLDNINENINLFFEIIPSNCKKYYFEKGFCKRPTANN